MEGRHPPPDLAEALEHARAGGLARLLALLERLDGRAEAAIARDALAAGVPPTVVAEEVEREVERRLARTARFYDERDW